MTAGYGQNTDLVDLSFKDKPLAQVIQLIEEQSDYKFYYQEDWLGERLYTGDFKNKDIREVLKDIFSEGALNFFIDNHKIILTRNTRIISSISSEFFKNSSDLSEDTISAPIFPQQFAKQIQQGTTGRELISLGKEAAAQNMEAYSVSGRILNSKNNQPVADVSVFTSDGAHSATTDQKGYFVITLPRGYYELETSLLGYSKIIQPILVYGNGSLVFELQEDIEMLDDVFIDANKDENIESAVMGVTSIDPEAIKTIPLVLGERDILKVAATLPGVSKAGEGAMGFNVRGGRADQNLILLDDAVIYSPSHFLGFFSAINPFTTGAVDIYKGNIPAEYGGRLSSVFDISTKDASMEEFSGEASIGPITGNIALEIPVVKDKASLTVGARAAYSDWILNSLSEENLKNSEAAFYDGLLKYKHELSPKDEVQLTLYYSDDKFSITTDSLFNYQNALGSLKWQHEFNDHHKTEVSLVHSSYDYNIDYNSNNIRSFVFGYSIKESQAKIKLDYRPAALEKHEFQYGISSKLYNISPGNIRPLDEESIISPLSIAQEKGLESALFLSDSYELNDKVLINLGLRYSFYAALGPGIEQVYQEGTIKSESSVVEELEFGNNEFIKTYGGPELRASLRYLLGPSLSIKGGYNRTIQYIHLLSNNTTMSPTDTYKLSDYNTQPQQANQYALGLYKNIQNKDLELSLEVYYKTMKDLLDYKVGADLVLNENIETELLKGEGKAYGIEFLIKKNAGDFNGYLGYSYARSYVKLNSAIPEQRVNNGNFFPANFDKPHDFSFVGNYRITKRYSISANFAYQTGRPVTYPVGRFYYEGQEQVLYSDRNKYRIPDYYRLDLGVNIEGNHKKNKLGHSFWNISVYNVLGRNNPYSVYFVNDEGQIQAYKTSIFAIPIPTITYNFKF